MSKKCFDPYCSKRSPKMSKACRFPNWHFMIALEFCHRTCHPSPRWRCSAVSVWQIATEALEGLHEEGAEMPPHPDQTQHLGAEFHVAALHTKLFPLHTRSYRYDAVCSSVFLCISCVIPWMWCTCCVGKCLRTHDAVVCCPMDALTRKCKPNLSRSHVSPLCQ